jgi:hypothetical protein
MLAELGEQRDAEQQAAERAEEGERNEDAARVGAVGQESRLDQRVAASAALPQHEGAEKHRSGGQREKGPGRPPVGATLDQRIDDCGQREADQRHPDGVQADPRMRNRPGQHSDRPDEGRQADRHVDEEHQPPPDPPQVGLHQPTRQDRRGEDRETHHRPEGSEDLGHLLLGEDLFEHPESLGDHQRPERALQHPEGDQHLHRWRRRARRGHQGETGRADQEQPPAAEHVAQARTGDQEHSEREGVAGGQPLQGGGAATECGPNRRAGDVDDRRVQEIHDVGGDHDCEHEPAQRVGASR